MIKFFVVHSIWFSKRNFLIFVRLNYINNNVFLFWSLDIRRYIERVTSFKLGVFIRSLYYSSEQVSGSTSYISDNPSDGPDLVGTRVLPWVILFHLSLHSSLIAWDHLLIHPSLLLRSDPRSVSGIVYWAKKYWDVGGCSREEKKKKLITSIKYKEYKELFDLRFFLFTFGGIWNKILIEKT